MQKLFNKFPILAGLLFGYGLSILFLLLERLLLDYAYTDKWVYIDGAIRFIFGILGLLILKSFNKESFINKFKNKIDKRTLLFLMPLVMYFCLEFALLAYADNIVFSHVSSFFIMWITQITTGLWEETASRGGMLLKWKSTIRGRIMCVLLSGLLFGLLHLFGFIYGNSIIDCLWSGLYAGIWGMFIAAIYMMSENLLLVMLIHTIWDIIVRIPDYFVADWSTGILLKIIYILQDIIQLGVFPITAILICIFAFGNESKEHI